MEKILAFQMNETDLSILERIAGQLNIRLDIIDKADFKQTVENLVTNNKIASIEKYDGTGTYESMILMCDLSDKKMDKLLLSIRKNQLKIGFKAILTPTNRKWNVLKLYLEMERERNAFIKKGL